MGKGRFKAAMKFAGDMMDASYERRKKIDAMADELSKRTYVTDVTQLRAIAATLVDRATVTWK